jgi:hypothetical protein
VIIDNEKKIQKKKATEALYEHYLELSAEVKALTTENTTILKQIQAKESANELDPASEGALSTKRELEHLIKQLQLEKEQLIKLKENHTTVVKVSTKGLHKLFFCFFLLQHLIRENKLLPLSLLPKMRNWNLVIRVSRKRNCRNLNKKKQSYWKKFEIWNNVSLH